MSKEHANDPTARVVQGFIDRLEQGGIGEWLKPWQNGTGMQCNAEGMPYNGFNQLILAMEAYEKGYDTNRWLVGGRVRKEGGHIKKGEHASTILRPLTARIRETDENGQEQTRIIVKGFEELPVFNVSQTEGLPEHFYQPPLVRNKGERIAEAEAFFGNLGADIRHGGNAAFYVPSQDYIQIPPFESFNDPESFYATLAHEAIHWAGHKSRCGDLPEDKYGQHTRALEELVAELGSAITLASIGIAPEPREESAQYLANWIAAAREKPAVLYSVTKRAEERKGHLVEQVERRKGPADQRLEELVGQALDAIAQQAEERVEGIAAQAQEQEPEREVA